MLRIFLNCELIWWWFMVRIIVLVRMNFIIVIFIIEWFIMLYIIFWRCFFYVIFVWNVLFFIFLLRIFLKEFLFLIRWSSDGGGGFFGILKVIFLIFFWVLMEWIVLIRIWILVVSGWRCFSVLEFVGYDMVVLFLCFCFVVLLWI